MRYHAGKGRQVRTFPPSQCKSRQIIPGRQSQS
jgi:hypothetical protein